jgi:hypothetical protein
MIHDDSLLNPFPDMPLLGSVKGAWPLIVEN